MTKGECCWMYESPSSAPLIICPRILTVIWQKTASRCDQHGFGYGAA